MQRKVPHSPVRAIPLRTAEAIRKIGRMAKQDAWRAFTDPRRAAAVVKAALADGWARSAVVGFLGVSESTLRSWDDGTVEILRPSAARDVRRLSLRLKNRRSA